MVMLLMQNAFYLTMFCNYFSFFFVFKRAILNATDVDQDLELNFFLEF